MADVLELVVTRKLESANVLRGYHWRRWCRETQWWQALLRVAICDPVRLQAWNLIEKTELRKDHRGHYTRIFEQRKQERRRVTVLRYVKNRRQFVKDDDNLAFSVKPLNDALKRLGLIYDDHRKWMEQPLPEQLVSPDGIARTVVRIERLQEATHAA